MNMSVNRLHVAFYCKIILFRSISFDFDFIMCVKHYFAHSIRNSPSLGIANMYLTRDIEVQCNERKFHEPDESNDSFHLLCYEHL